MNSVLRTCILAMLTTSVAAGCTEWFGFDGLRLGASDAGPEAATDAMPPCGHRAPPSRHAATGGSLDLVFAVSEADFGWGMDDGGTPRYLSLGYDLDSTCTGWGQGPSCLEPAWATQYKDGVDGIDNASGPLTFQTVGPVSFPVPLPWASGHAPLIRVRGYSGELDDDHLDVSLYVGVSIDGRSVPLWDGADRWMIHPGSSVASLDAGGVIGSVEPKFSDHEAYVSGGTLVAQVPEVDWGFGTKLVPDLLSHFEQFILTARLVQTESGWELENGVMAGRVPLANMFEWIALDESISHAGEVRCRYPDEYRAKKQDMCIYVDISEDSDRPSPCNAFSYAMGFRAKQALIGGVAPTPGAPPACAPNVQPKTETCATNP